MQINIYIYILIYIERYTHNGLNDIQHRFGKIFEAYDATAQPRLHYLSRHPNEGRYGKDPRPFGLPARPRWENPAPIAKESIAWHMICNKYSMWYIVMYSI